MERSFLLGRSVSLRFGGVGVGERRCGRWRGYYDSFQQPVYNGIGREICREYGFKVIICIIYFINSRVRIFFSLFRPF